jgi:hypothetical protein
MSTNPFDDDYVEPAPKPAHAGIDSHIRYYHGLVQRSEDWYAVRCGMITASIMKHFLTVKTLKKADNQKARDYLWELLAQRVNNYVEPSFEGYAIQRGYEEEIEACILYGKHYAPVSACGFVTNNRHGFMLGYSPDGLVGEDGQVEAKSRIQKFQAQLIVTDYAMNTIPDDFAMQVQTGLIVTERQWCDFLSYSNGMNMAVIRVHPDPVIQNAIIEVAGGLERQLENYRRAYEEQVANDETILPVERKVYEYEQDDTIITHGD